MRSTLVSLLLCVAFASIAAGGDLQRAIALHQKGVAGDKDAIAQCVATLEKHIEANPDDALARVWLGSAQTLYARDVSTGAARLTLLRQAGRAMDEAVESAPKEPAVRLVRALNNYHLPAIFGRKKVAREDFRLLLRQLEAPNTLSIPERQQIYYYAGLSQSGREAQETWKKGLALDPNSGLAALIRKKIQ